MDVDINPKHFILISVDLCIPVCAGIRIILKSGPKGQS